MNFPLIQNHSQLQRAVYARDLYNFLKPTERFSSWFERQLQYGFTSGIDYLGCEVFNALANRTLQDFALSIDMAKEVSMIQRSKKGREVRQYFIECERKALAAAKPKIPQTYAEALQLAADQALKIEQDAPKVQFFDTVAEKENMVNISGIAKKIGLTAQKLNKRLDTLGAYDKRQGRRVFNDWVIRKGYGAMVMTSSGYDQPMITQAGQAWIVGLFGGLK